LSSALGLACLAFNLTVVSSAHAAAPQRANQPYAEDICSTDPNIIFCEDFNYPQNFFCSSPVDRANHRWTNPAWAEEQRDFVWGCMGRQINTATTYPAKPIGALGSGSQSDHVWVANWDAAKGYQDNGGSPGKLRLKGGNYVNGSAPAKDFYVRFQIYWTSNYAWPGDPKTDKYRYSTNCVDNKIVFIGPVEWGDNPTAASYDAGPLTGCAVWDPVTNSRYSDALTFRVGTASDNYKTFPLCAQCSSNNQHNEYAPYQCTENTAACWRNPHDTPKLGKIFRFDTNKWYTVEFRYKLSSGNGQKDGTIEAWIDGTKIYSASDLETCTNSGISGDCSGLGYVWVGAYHNNNDSTDWDGQQVIDNLVISRSYIGPPRGGASASPQSPSSDGSPAPPTNLRIQ
jgi:hypothetical protein